MKPHRILLNVVAVALLLMVGGGVLSAQDGNHEGPKGPVWMPPGTSTTAPEVDRLWTFIFWVTGITFVGVEALLLVFCFIYRRKPGGKPGYTHGNTTAEIIWTVLPATMLLIIAIVQMPAWRKAKMEFPPETDPNVVKIQVLGRQFQWEFRYAGEDKKHGTEDDVYSGRTFRMAIGQTALMPLRSIDVIHSFFIPNMRVKQDTVPGLRNQVWFKPTGFWVVKLSRTELSPPAGTPPGGPARPYNPAFSKDFKPVSNKEKWLWVDSEEDYQKKFGQSAMALQEFVYEGGQFRIFKWEKKVSILQNNEVKMRPASEAEYAIVPYEVPCAELCGEGHYTMRATLYIVPQKAYEAWLTDEDNVGETNCPDDVLKIWKTRWKD